ncbi:hypothetical protein ACFQ1E_07355 [Sphingomonas canadensis]|uniref:Tetratricopeptide repeat protein n=1 Tax=Sphingomonas canadensis TaxID=1219257 RepID=A0ABW3H9N9_9SPHN|nr:hypothetical protein [Sphingomonas canadensis]MCW3835399.1 hypothetical protein [Sphingomonas canadensis]
MPVAGSILQPRVLLIWGVALLAAVFLGASALGGVAKGSSPALALSVSPRNGFAYQNLAAQKLILAGTNFQNGGAAAGQAALAREALRREPYAVTAISILAMASEARGDGRRAGELFRMANAFSKREQIANSWLILDSSKSGDGAAALRLVDEALRVRPDQATLYVPALAQGLAQPGVVPFFRAALARNPDWSGQFWSAVTEVPAALPNAVQLREQMLGGTKEAGDIDRELVLALVKNERFDLAMQLGRRFAPIDLSVGLVRNPGFAEEETLPPLDWDLLSDGRTGAALDPVAGVLEVSAESGSSGVVARQLVEVPPGDYALLAKLATATLPSGSELLFHLRCAGAGATPPLLARLEGEVDLRFTAEPDSCRYRWLEIEFSAIDASSSASARLGDVRISAQRRVR